jgi:hypothetical protein
VRTALLALRLLLTACGLPLPDDEAGDPHLNRIALPDGFQVSVFPDQLPEARSMAPWAEGTLFVGNREGDRVYALRDGDAVAVAGGRLR